MNAILFTFWTYGTDETVPEMMQDLNIFFKNAVFAGFIRFFVILRQTNSDVNRTASDVKFY